MIEANCARIDRNLGSAGKDAARLFQRVVRYWADDDFALAVEAAEHASRQIARNPDVWGLLGRAYLKLQPPEAGKADVALRKAAELGSQRPELLPLRLEAKNLLGDVLGVVQLLEAKGGPLDATETLALARFLQTLAGEQARVGD